MRFSMQILRRSNSLFGLVLAGVHAVVLIALIASKDPLPHAPPCAVNTDCLDYWQFASTSLIAGRSFHLSYETPLIQFLMVADLPGVLAGSIALLIPKLLLMSIAVEAISYLDAFAWILFGSGQWWSIGGYLHRLRSGRERNSGFE
jgi:hypothetical protein